MHRNDFFPRIFKVFSRCVKLLPENYLHKPTGRTFAAHRAGPPVRLQTKLNAARHYRRYSHAKKILRRSLKRHQIVIAQLTYSMAAKYFCNCRYSRRKTGRTVFFCIWRCDAAAQQS